MSEDFWTFSQVTLKLVLISNYNRRQNSATSDTFVMEPKVQLPEVTSLSYEVPELLQEVPGSIRHLHKSASFSPPHGGDSQVSNTSYLHLFPVLAEPLKKCCDCFPIVLLYILNHQIMEYWKTTVTILLPLLANIFSYWGLLRSGGLNTRKYWLVEVIENDCIVTRVGVYDEISPEPSSRHNTVTLHHTGYFASFLGHFLSLHFVTTYNQRPLDIIFTLQHCSNPMYRVPQKQACKARRCASTSSSHLVS